MATRTHKEIMLEDGFQMTRGKKRRLKSVDVEKAKSLCFDTTESSVTEEQVRLVVQNAHKHIDDHLSNQM
jgi:hypothetical protein